MPIMNSFKSPQMLRKNNENDVHLKTATKPDIGNVKPKKKALADVGNIVHQKNNNCEGTKVIGKWKIEASEKIQKTQSPFCLSTPQTCEDDKTFCDDHNWSICDKYNDGDNDGFLPNLELTPQQLHSYTLDWDIKPKSNGLKLKEIDVMEIKEPKSSEWCSFNQFCDDQWFKITTDYSLLLPVA